MRRYHEGLFEFVYRGDYSCPGEMAVACASEHPELFFDSAVLSRPSIHLDWLFAQAQWT